jgi:hypothetical protein
MDESRQKHKKNQQKKFFLFKMQSKIRKKPQTEMLSTIPKKSEKAVKESHLFDGNEIFQILVIFLRVAIIAKKKKKKFSLMKVDG